MPDPQRIAVVDLGTNSTRLLIADVMDGRVNELDRRTEVTRLGQGVDAAGRLDPGAMERVFATVAAFRKAIDGRGATKVVGVATSAVREARNGEAFRNELAERFGVDARTISGDEEARLTFLGATAGRPADDGGTLVIDIGGGSTEYVVGSSGLAPSFHVSTRLGSVRQTERHLSADPPSRRELEALEAATREIVTAETPAEVRGSVRNGIAVAGTATSLAAIDQQLEPYDPTRVHGYTLHLDACRRMLAMLAALPLEERRNVPGLLPERAPTIVAGAVILIESMVAFALESMETSEADLLHGAALDANTRVNRRGKMG